MADRSSRAVVDASVLIAHLNREEGRFDKSRELLTDAEAGRLDLWAPMVIQVEVTRWSKDADPTDPEGRARLDAFLQSDWLHVVEVDRRMARIARDVVAKTSAKTGVDALYVATAVIVEERTVTTWDDRLQTVSYEGIAGAEPPGAAEPQLDLEGPELDGWRGPPAKPIGDRPSTYLRPTRVTSGMPAADTGEGRHWMAETRPVEYELLTITRCRSRTPRGAGITSARATRRPVSPR